MGIAPISEIYRNILYFLDLTISTEVLWIVLPLAIATVVMIVYFERYKEERPGWNTYVANSLVLLFVSVILFRYIFGIAGAGAVNFVNFPEKTFVAVALLIIGIIILFTNFAHFLPEKIAMQISSPLTLNLIGYTAILYVYSTIQNNWEALFIIFVILLVPLNLIKKPIEKFFRYIKRMKQQEKVGNIIQEKRKIKTQKKEIKKEEVKVKKAETKKLDKQKKEAVKLKKIVRNPLPKKD